MTHLDGADGDAVAREHRRGPGAGESARRLEFLHAHQLAQIRPALILHADVDVVADRIEKIRHDLAYRRRSHTSSGSRRPPAQAL